MGVFSFNFNFGKEVFSSCLILQTGYRKTYPIISEQFLREFREREDWNIVRGDMAGLQSPRGSDLWRVLRYVVRVGYRETLGRILCSKIKPETEILWTYFAIYNRTL